MVLDDFAVVAFFSLACNPVGSLVVGFLRGKGFDMELTWGAVVYCEMRGALFAAVL